MPHVVAQNVTVIYKGKGKADNTVALDGFCADFVENGVNVVLGYSGCGKTTLLRAISGVAELYDGSILFDGEPADGLSVQQRNVAQVAQDFTLYPHLTVFDNIAFPLKIEKLPRAEITKRVLESAAALDISVCLTRKPKQLSIGQQQRVALARALVKRPSICLLDEPFSNVDNKLKDRLRPALKAAFRAFDCTVVFVTHDLAEATALADNLIVMDKGKAVFSGTPEEFFASDNPVIASLKL